VKTSIPDDLKILADTFCRFVDMSARDLQMNIGVCSLHSTAKISPQTKQLNPVSQNAELIFAAFADLQLPFYF